MDPIKKNLLLQFTGRADIKTPTTPKPVAVDLAGSALIHISMQKHFLEIFQAISEEAFNVSVYGDNPDVRFTADTKTVFAGIITINVQPRKPNEDTDALIDRFIDLHRDRILNVKAVNDGCQIKAPPLRIYTAMNDILETFETSKHLYDSKIVSHMLSLHHLGGRMDYKKYIPARNLS